VTTGIGPPEEKSGTLAIADDRGTVTRRFRIGNAIMPDQPFSPDGRRVVVSAYGLTRVLDLATGAELARATGEAIGWYDDSSYLVTSGSSLRRVELATGRVMGRWQLPISGQPLNQVWLKRLDGPAPDGAIVF
jgi:hypothetical protein